MDTWNYIRKVEAIHPHMLECESNKASSRISEKLLLGADDDDDRFDAHSTPYENGEWKGKEEDKVGVR
jgi:hypothetical protein